MIVRCARSSADELPTSLLQPGTGLDESTQFAVREGAIYAVFALTVHEGCIWYYLCDEEYAYYPVWYPSPLFELVSGEISRHWVYNLWTPREGGDPIMAFPEWANCRYYYDRLTDGEEPEVSIFQRYKDLIEQDAETELRSRIEPGANGTGSGPTNELP